MTGPAELALAALGVIIVCMVVRRFVLDVPATERSMVLVSIAVVVMTVLGDSVLARSIGVSQVGVLFVTLGAVAVVAFRLNAAGTILTLPSTLLAPTLIVVFAWAANLRNGGLVSESELLLRLLPAVYWLAVAFWLANSRLPVRFYARSLILSYGLALALGPVGAASWRPCDVFKCSAFGALYTGIFASENQLGILAGSALLAIPAARLGSAAALLGFATIGFTFAVTTARSSLIAVLVSGCVLALVFVLSRFSSFLARGIGGLVTGVLLAISCSAIFTTDPDRFSHRGAIWIVARRALEGEWLSGIGISRWTYLQWGGRVPQLFPHNEFLVLTIAGGLVCSSLYLTWLLILVFRNQAVHKEFNVCSTNLGLGAAAAIVAFMAILGTTEAFWNPLALTGSYFLIGALMVCDLAVRGEERKLTLWV